MTKDFIKTIVIALGGSIIFFGIYFTITTIIADHENIDSVVTFLNAQVAASQKQQAQPVAAPTK